jgi:hypothetical protein
MLRPHFWLLALVAGFAVEALRGQTSAAPTSGLLVGQAWAGNPVNFAFLTQGDRQFVAYYDAERKITVAARRLGSTGWTTVHPEGRYLEKAKRDSNVTGWDSHNYLALVLDHDGFLHLSGNMHVDALVYYRSSRPFDISSLERLDRMTGERETSCTYPVFFQNTAGDLFYRYRDGGSGNGSDLYNAFDPATHTWRRLVDTALLDGEKKRNAYALDPTPGPDGRFHLVWMWRNTPDCSTNNNLSYARSRDLIHWEDHLGRPITLPVTLARGDVIDAAQPREGLINMTFALGFDAQKLPVVVYHRYDAAGHSQLFAARPDGDGWRTRALTDWTFKWAFSGGGSISGDVLLAAPQLTGDGLMIVPYQTAALGAGRVRFRAADLTPQSVLPSPAAGAGVSWASGAAAALTALQAPHNAGMEVSLKLSHQNGICYVLRWETMPRNRDQPRAQIPPPTELRVFEIPDPANELVLPAAVGS